MRHKPLFNLPEPCPGTLCAGLPETMPLPGIPPHGHGHRAHRLKRQMKKHGTQMDYPLKDRWTACLEYIRQHMPDQAFQTWFAPLEPVSYDTGVLTVCTPNRYVYEYIEEHYLDTLTQALVVAFGQGIQLKYRIRAEQAPQPEKPTEKPASKAQAPKLPPLDPQLNPCYTFENFVEGVSNKLARTVALSIANKPGQVTFNPFFLYGPSGVGKTHLVNAIGVRIREKYPEKRVLFVSAHVFRTQYTDSVLHNTFNDFIHFYQTIDVLIIDDIQELTTAKTQQAFFHIFNHLQQNRRQLVITCDRPPVLFEGIEERMLTRFKWGMVAELERPDTELRKAILQSKIRRDGLSFPEEVIQYIAQNVSDSVRDLEGIVNSIMAYSVVYNCDIDLALTARIVARAVNLEKKELTLEDIVQKACAHFGVKQKEINSKSRKQNIVQARQLSMYLCRKYTDMPTSQIGQRIGRRDHSTVLHACKQVEHRIATDKTYRLEVEKLEASLK